MLGCGICTFNLLLFFTAYIYNACVSQDIFDDNPVMSFAMSTVIVGPCFMGVGLILLFVGFCVYGTKMSSVREPPADEISLEEGRAGQRCHTDWPE